MILNEFILWMAKQSTKKRAAHLFSAMPQPFDIHCICELTNAHHRNTIGQRKRQPNIKTWIKFAKQRPQNAKIWICLHGFLVCSNQSLSLIFVLCVCVRVCLCILRWQCFCLDPTYASRQFYSISSYEIRSVQLDTANGEMRLKDKIVYVCVWRISRQISIENKHHKHASQHCSECSPHTNAKYFMVTTPTRQRPKKTL